MKKNFFRLKNVKSILKKVFLFLFVFICFFLLIINAYNKTLFDNIKLKTLDLFTPVLTLLETPFNYIGLMIDGAGEYVFMATKNQLLKTENEKLLHWRSLALSLQADNKALQKIVNYKQSEGVYEYTVRVLVDYNSPFSQSIIIMAGANQGVKKGDVLFTPAGIYARVIDVDDDVSRALKLTDYYSRVPVQVGTDKINAILMGDNTSKPVVIAFEQGSNFAVGDIVLSSGNAGVYPANIPIGKISSIAKNEVRVNLFAFTPPDEFILVKSYNLTGLLEKIKE